MPPYMNIRVGVSRICNLRAAACSLRWLLLLPHFFHHTAMLSHCKNNRISVNTLWNFLLLTLLTLLTACASPVMKPEQAVSIKTVGVVSLLPSELSYQKIGITVFNNEYAKRPVDNAFNLAARQGAERALKQSGRNVIQLDVDTNLLAKRIRSSTINFDSPAENIKNELLPLVEQYKLDAIVLIMESFDPENGINGIRLFLRAGFGSIGAAVVMPDVQTLVVDKEIKKLAYDGRPVRFAAKRADGAPWVYRLEDNLSASTHQHISDLVRNSINELVAGNIVTMGF